MSRQTFFVAFPDDRGKKFRLFGSMPGFLWTHNRSTFATWISLRQPLDS
jgi:hypothetical protein